MTITADQRERLERLHSALVNDVTDEMGIRDNVIPGTRIRPVWSRANRLSGRLTRTARVEIGYREGEDDEDDDQNAEDIDFFQYLEAVEEGDFVVMAAPKDTEVGLWGRTPEQHRPGERRDRRAHRRPDAGLTAHRGTRVPRLV